MKLRLKLISLALVSSAVLVGCSSNSQAEETSSTTREASLRGSRICVVNSSDVPMSAAIAGAVVPENSNTLVGKPGDLSSTELCFAGWNAIKTTSLYTDKEPGGGGEVNTTDVAVGVNIDGNYNEIKFRAFNGLFKPPVLWWLVQDGNSDNWGGGSFSDQASKTGSVDGHNFTVIRRGDSDNYKEFLVTFTK